MKKKRLQRSDVLWMVAVSVLILLQFWWLPGNPGTPDDTYSKTIEGKRGFFETLFELSHAGMLPSVRRETDRLIPSRPCTLVIVSPDRYPNENEQRELSQFVVGGGTLLFTPNWSDTDCSMPQLSIKTEHKFFAAEDLTNRPQPASTGGQPPSGAKDPGDPSTTLPAEADDPTTGNSETSGGSQHNGQPLPLEDQTLVPDSDKVKQKLRREMSVGSPRSEESDVNDVSEVNASSPLVRGGVVWRTRAAISNPHRLSEVLVESAGGDAQAASWPLGRGLIVLSASPDVFSNSSMLDPVRAELAVRLVEHAHRHHGQPMGTSGTRDIVVSEFLNTSDKYHGAAVLVSPALRSGTLQLILVAFLAGWYGFHRFGPAKRLASSERRSLTESAASVGNLHFRTASGAEAVRSYLDYVTVQLQKTFGPSVRLENTKVIAARSGLDIQDVDQAINNALHLAGQQKTSAPAAAGAIRQLTELLSCISGSRKDST